MTGMKSPSMVYGLAWKQERTQGLVVKAVLAGFKGIDTACQPKHYYQPGLGAALVELQQQHGIARSNLWIQTKFTSLDGQDLKQPLPYDRRSTLADQVRQSFATSLKELQTNYIDSLVMHSPMQTREETMIVWNVFEDLVRSKQVNQIGISNIYDPAMLRWLFENSEIQPAVVQNRFRAETGYDAEILKLCQKYSAKYQSFWTLSANPHLLQHPILLKLASAQGITPSSTLFKFLMQSTKFGQGTITPLSGTTNSDHMIDCVEVMRLVEKEGNRELTADEISLQDLIWP